METMDPCGSAQPGAGAGWSGGAGRRRGPLGVCARRPGPLLQPGIRRSDRRPAESAGRRPRQRSVPQLFDECLPVPGALPDETTGGEPVRGQQRLPEGSEAETGPGTNGVDPPARCHGQAALPATPARKPLRHRSPVRTGGRLQHRSQLQIHPGEEVPGCAARGQQSQPASPTSIEARPELPRRQAGARLVPVCGGQPSGRDQVPCVFDRPSREQEPRHRTATGRDRQRPAGEQRRRHLLGGGL